MKPSCRAVVIWRELDVAFCPKGCGLRTIEALAAGPEESPGLCDHCGATTCGCDECLDEAVYGDDGLPGGVN